MARHRGNVVQRLEASFHPSAVGSAGMHRPRARAGTGRPRVTERPVEPAAPAAPRARGGAGPGHGSARVDQLSPLQLSRSRPGSKPSASAFSSGRSGAGTVSGPRRPRRVRQRRRHHASTTAAAHSTSSEMAQQLGDRLPHPMLRSGATTWGDEVLGIGARRRYAAGAMSGIKPGMMTLITRPTSGDVSLRWKCVRRDNRTIDLRGDRDQRQARQCGEARRRRATGSRQASASPLGLLQLVRSPAQPAALRRPKPPSQWPGFRRCAAIPVSELRKRRPLRSSMPAASATAMRSQPTIRAADAGARLGAAAAKPRRAQRGSSAAAMWSTHPQARALERSWLITMKSSTTARRWRQRRRGTSASPAAGWRGDKCQHRRGESP